MADFLFKRSATFLLTCQHQDAAGAPVALTGISATAELRDTQNNLVAMLLVTDVPEQPGTYILTYEGDTSGWPLGLLRMDVKFLEADGTVSYTETVTAAVVDRVTQ